MPALFGQQYNEHQLTRCLGHLYQVGGVQLYTFSGGPARGVRFLEFRTGTGFIYKVCVDRGMDVSYCEYQGRSLAWIPPTQFPGPWFFGEQADFGWLRSAMGGLINSCGLLHIGNPAEVDVSHYNFPARQKERYGVHDRIALAPGRLISYGETWEEDRCRLEATAELTQAQPYGENLRLTRRYTSWLGVSSLFLHDVVENCGFARTTHMFLYHINIGFPFVAPGAEFLAPTFPNKPPEALVVGIVDRNPLIIEPQPQQSLQVYQHDLISRRDSSTAVGVINPTLNGGSGLGVYVRYNSNEFPCFIESRMLGEGLYAVSIEPCTNRFDRDALERSGKLIVLEPGEKREYHLEVGILDGKEEINNFQDQTRNLATEHSR